MDIHSRLKLLRRHLNLTTRAFGASINMSGGAITNMENGTRNITDRTIRDICRQYNVNPIWLTDGMGPMFDISIDSPNTEDEIKQLVRQYSLLSDSDKDLVRRMVNSLAEKTNIIP